MSEHRNPIEPHRPTSSTSSSISGGVSHQQGTRYDRIVSVPPHRSHSQTSSIRMGHRQPTEHPSDGGYIHASQIGGGDASNLVGAMSSASLHGSTEQSENRFQDSGHDCLLERNHQRVLEWTDQVSSEAESFVIEHDDFTGVGCDSNLNDDSDQYYMSRSMNNPGRSGFENDSSDDETGLQKSLSGIQGPPIAGAGAAACSRQSSSGSQSSLESSISFRTVCMSDVYPGKSQAQLKNDDAARVPANQNHTPIEHRQNLALSRPQMVASTEPYFGRSQSHPDGTRPSGQSGVRQINQNADQASREGHQQKSTSVFITYAEEQQNPGFKRLVLQLTRTLLSNGIQVRLDMLESTLMSMSVNSWLDDNIQKCDFVIVCVSQSYKSEVEQPVLPETPDPHSLHTRYIYNRLLTEYIQNGSRNYRFIPVLIGGATRRDLPSLCLDTTVYEWPHQYESIIYRLFRKEKYIQPKVGPPPRCTVETYGMHEAAAMGQ